MTLLGFLAVTLLTLLFTSLCVGGIYANLKREHERKRARIVVQTDYHVRRTISDDEGRISFPGSGLT